jgi:hypothetical protein
MPRCNELHLSVARIANSVIFRSNYLRLSGVSNSHYLRMRSDYLRPDCNHPARITLCANGVSVGNVPLAVETRLSGVA